MYRFHKSSFIALSVSLSFASFAVVQQDDDARFGDAMSRYEVGHYEAAFAAFGALADSGHCEATRIAHQMARHGRALYALEFRVEPERLQRWARRGGCPAATALR